MEEGQACRFLDMEPAPFTLMALAPGQKGKMKIGITERGDAAFSIPIWMKALEEKQVDGAIIITKDPRALLPLTLPSNTIIHCTITGYGGSDVEPKVLGPEQAIDAYHELYQKYGCERVVLRIDPINPYRMMGPEKVARQSLDRIRISFLDMYNHVRDRLMQAGIPWEDDWTGFHAPIEVRRKAYEEISLQGLRDVEVCSEPGFPCTGCVSERDLKAIGLIGGTPGGKQRRECKCLAEKYELLNQRGQCPHGCLYCYWR